VSILKFVTTNTEKVAQARQALALYGVSVEQLAIDLVESRAEDPAEIALEKAEQAFLLGHKPVIVEDSGFFIHALGNFPQTHVKFSLKTLGIERILKMLVDEPDRSCSWRRSVAYVGETGLKKVFTLVEPGVLALAPRPVVRPVMSDYWRIYIPKFFPENEFALSEMPESEYEKLLAYYAEHNHFTQVGEWLKNHKKASE
jgi:XTP/dITP diphosphohydrolase